MQTETEKLNTKWQQKTTELLKQHEAEKDCLRRLYEDGRELLSEFISRKCEKEKHELALQTVAETRIEMEKKCSDIVERELRHQAAVYGVQMEITLRNLAHNDAKRMEALKQQCLKAMDVQHHLLVCRQLTELLHMMTLEKRRWRVKLMDVKCEHEAPTERHPSTSIKHLWMELLAQLDQLDEAQLDAEERRMFDELRRCELLMAENRQIDEAPDAKSEELLIIHESMEGLGDAPERQTNLKWLRGVNDVPRTAPFIDVEWRKCESGLIEIPSDPFMESTLNRLVQPLHSMQIASVASSIIDKVRKSNDASKLQEDVSRMIQSVLDEAKSIVHPTVDVASVPKTEDSSLLLVSQHQQKEK